jgi:hypothetical protein
MTTRTATTTTDAGPEAQGSGTGLRFAPYDAVSFWPVEAQDHALAVRIRFADGRTFVTAAIPSHTDDCPQDYYCPAILQVSAE